MNQDEVTQPSAVAEAAERTAFPCDDCGGMVDLTSIITVRVQEVDGPDTVLNMTEAKARLLLDAAGVPRPPVMCDRHDDVGVIATEVAL